MTRRENKKFIIKVSLAALAMFLLVALGLFLLHYWEAKSNAGNEVEIEGQESSGYLIIDGKKYAPKPVKTVLLIGIDKFAAELQTDSYNNQQQCDFLLLMVIDPVNRICTPLQINRDTIAPVTALSVSGEPIGLIDEQIALSHTYGSGKEDSCENTVRSVSAILMDQTIDHYFSVTMDAVQMLNDLVGGVTVSVEDDFSNIDDTLILGEEVTLLGPHALTFVRSRASLEDSTNLSRMERQRQYLSGLRQKTVAAMEDDVGFAVDTLLEISPYMVSDCTVNQLAEIADAVAKYEMQPIQTLQGEAIKGAEYIEYYLDDEARFNTVASLFYDEVVEYKNGKRLPR